MVSPTHCLVGVALFFSVFSWIVGIIAMAVPKWYVIESSDGNTDIGAFQICVPSAAGSTEKTCDSQGFSFPECDRGSDALRARFGVVQGLGIVGIVLTVVATAILVAAFVKGCKRTRKQREEQRTARRNEPGYVPTPRNDPRPNDQRPEDQRDDIDEEEETRMPIMEIIALVLNLVGFVVFCAAAFHFLTSVKSWLFCDQSPCAYLESQGYTGCSDSIGWTFALAVIAWITALAAAICLALRWILLPSASKANSSESDEIGRPVGRQANGKLTKSSADVMRTAKNTARETTRSVDVKRKISTIAIRIVRTPSSSNRCTSTKPPSTSLTKTPTLVILSCSNSSSRTRHHRRRNLRLLHRKSRCPKATGSGTTRASCSGLSSRSTSTTIIAATSTSPRASSGSTLRQMNGTLSKNKLTISAFLSKKRKKATAR
eukprot:GILI01008834.1.p1 GENE.GILI01008834.1~~GILI01008834.1.p1  ORF type:complete len:431 (-),score=43.36 GILI01008834.1:364-1656(-)